MYAINDDDEYLRCFVDYKDEDLIEEDIVADYYGYGKNYDMLRQLILDAGSNYTEETNLTKLEFYLNNLLRVDSLKSFIDDQNCGLLAAAYLLMHRNCTKTEAILRYIVDHQNIEFHQNNVVQAADGSEYIFFKLIEAGGNVHQKSPAGYTALHVSVLEKRKNIIKYLLDQNVDVNCFNQDICTPLHYAFNNNNNLDIIELLIQKGADLYLENWEFLTPIEYAIKYKQFNNVVSVLYSKLTDDMVSFNLVKKVFFRFCHLHSENSQVFQYDLLRLPKPEGIIAYYDFFKFLSKKLIQKFITNNNIGRCPVLSIYLNNNVFKSKDWANALIVLLTSEIASTLLEECLSYHGESIYALLIPQFIRAGVEQQDRMTLLKLLLSLEMVPNMRDMALVLSHYRFNEEFQLLSLSLGEDCLVHGYNQENPMEYLASIFCGLEDDLDYNRIFSEALPENFYHYIKQYFTPAWSNCSSIAHYRNDEMNIPNILSFQELSRNSARKFVRNNQILSPRDFITAVQSLLIPDLCKNFILLKNTL